MSGRRGSIAKIALVVVITLVATQLAPVFAYAAATDVVNVRDFGAKGDGVTEDTAAFQAAVNAAAGKTLSIPAGTYKVGNIVVKNPTRIVGAGMTATKLKAKDYLNKEVFEVANTHDVYFADFEIDGNRAMMTGGKPSGINLDYVSDSLVERMYIHDCDKTGVCIYEGSIRVTVRDSHLAYNENDVEFHKSTYGQAVDNLCEYARTESLAAYEERYGPMVTGHNLMEGNRIYHSQTGMSFQKAHWNVARGNYVEDCTWGMVMLGIGDPVNQNTYDNVVENNTIVGGPKSAAGVGILADYWSHDATITGNVVRDWPLGPMGPAQLQAPKTVFTNNRIENAGQQVEISGSDMVFTGNTISRTAGVALQVTENVRNVRIENNTVEYCNDLAFQTLAELKDSTFLGNTLHDNCLTAKGPGIWVNRGSLWTNTVFAHNRLVDDQATPTQRGVYIQAGSKVAVADNTIPAGATSTWPTATAGDVVDIGAAASDGHGRWVATASGQPGTWTAADAAAVTPPPASPTEPATTQPATITAPAPVTGGTTGGTRGRKVKRIAGADRYATAVAISADSFESAGTVVLATGAQFPDALAASALAGSLDAPLLLTNPGSVRDDVFGEIARLQAKKVVIVGGTAAVSSSVEAALKDRGLAVERVAGPNRFDTSAQVARRVAGGTADTVFVARGDDFADALSVSPLAYGKHFPVLLTRTAGLPAETAAVLRDLAPKHVVIVGSANAVGTDVEKALKELCPDVQRVSGANRYATSAAIARFAVAKGWASASGVGIAAGDRFPDALGGGAASGNAGGLLLLTPPPVLSGETRGVLSELMTADTSINLYGGVGAVFTTVENDVRALAL